MKSVKAESRMPSATAGRLDDWMREEAQASALLAAGVGVGAYNPHQVAALEGMEIVRRMMLGRLPLPICSQTLRFLAISASPGTVVFQGSPAADQLNPMGTVHGGWISSILDSALGCAVLTTLPAGGGYFTVDLWVRYRAMLTLDTQRVRATATATANDGREAKAIGTLAGPDGKVYAEAEAVLRLNGTARRLQSLAE